VVERGPPVGLFRRAELLAEAGVSPGYVNRVRQSGGMPLSGPERDKARRTQRAEAA
jgi:hypothetical protein